MGTTWATINGWNHVYAGDCLLSLDSEAADFEPAGGDSLADALADMAGELVEAAPRGMDRQRLSDLLLDYSQNITEGTWNLISF